MEKVLLRLRSLVQPNPGWYALGAALLGSLLGALVAWAWPLRESLVAAMRRLTTQSREGDEVAIVLIGHGSAGDGNNFNLTGPDIDAEHRGAIHTDRSARLPVRGVRRDHDQASGDGAV